MVGDGILSDDADLEAAGAYASVSNGFGHSYRSPANPFGFDVWGRSVPRLNDYQIALSTH